jgi:hypothetical protein
LIVVPGEGRSCDSLFLFLVCDSLFLVADQDEGDRRGWEHWSGRLFLCPSWFIKRVYRGKRCVFKEEETSAGLDRIVVKRERIPDRWGCKGERASAVSRPNITGDGQQVFVKGSYVSGRDAGNDEISQVRRLSILKRFEGNCCNLERNSLTD